MTRARIALPIHVGLARYGKAASHVSHIKDEVTQQETIIIIPGAASMDRVKLQELIHWAEEKELVEMKARGPHPSLQRVVSREDVGQAIKDFHHRQALARNRTGRRYHQT